MYNCQEYFAVVYFQHSNVCVMLVFLRVCSIVYHSNDNVTTDNHKPGNLCQALRQRQTWNRSRGIMLSLFTIKPAGA